MLEGMPPEAWREFVDQHILPELDHGTREQTDQVLQDAIRVNAVYATMPTLGLCGRRWKLSNLLAKVASSAEWSDQEKILGEMVQTIAGWLSDIWRVVCEFQTNFIAAHACLVHLIELRIEMQEHTMYNHTNMAIVNSTGTTVQVFNIAGLLDIDAAVLWIWKELFTSLLASTSIQGVDNLVQEMLNDITDMLGWASLQKMLIDSRTSRRLCTFCVSHCVAAEGSVDIGITRNDSQEGGGTPDAALSVTIGQEHQATFYRISDRDHTQLPLGAAVEAQLILKFSEFPSRDLFCCIVSLSEQAPSTQDRLLRILDEVAPSSSDTVAAALSIYVDLQSTESMLALLKSHGFLLRYSDHVHLQSAMGALALHAEHVPMVLRRIEQELGDITKGASAAVLRVFGHIDDCAHRKELRQLLKLDKRSSQRGQCIGTWVSAVTTLRAGLDPLSMIMSLMDLGPETHSSSEGVLYNAMTVGGGLSPYGGFYLVERLEGWISLARSTRDGRTVLSRAYSEILHAMPFLEAEDVVEEMLRWYEICHTRR
ncbi:hypothetical protein EV122DRAFT_225422 [Schizophyllum commune]